MTLRIGLRKALDTIAGLPDDGWTEVDHDAFHAARSVVRSELALIERQEARHAAAKAAKAARPPAAPTPQRERRKAGERRWYTARAEVLAEHPCCQACDVLFEERNRPVQRATEVHHMAGRTGARLWEGPFLAVCHRCHCWITEHPKEALALGLSLKRNGAAS